MKKVVTLIPARGGSKGIEKKNIVEVNGKPLLSYTIAASLASTVDETWVSTDDDEIASVAIKCGAKVIKRPLSLSTDESISESALLHFAENESFDILVFLQATCPFIMSKDINDSIKLMTKYDSVVSVSKLDQLFLWNDSGPMYDINNRKRRQDREENYIETGSMFVTTRKGLVDNKNRLSGNIGFVKVPKWRSIDIDTHEDLELVRKIMHANS
jgi:CMP-N,N'-diacetyllegionaminic acid synthase